MNNRFTMIASVYLLLFDGQKVLLLKRCNTGFCDDQYGLPAGHVDGNERLVEAMKREAKEEIGIDIDESKLKFVHTMHRNCGDHERVDFFFAYPKYQEPVNTEPHKCSELKWASLDELPDETIDYYKQMFMCVQDGQFYSEYNWK